MNASLNRYQAPDKISVFLYRLTHKEPFFFVKSHSKPIIYPAPLNSRLNSFSQSCASCNMMRSPLRVWLHTWHTTHRLSVFSNILFQKHLWKLSKLCCCFRDQYNHAFLYGSLHLKGTCVGWKEGASLFTKDALLIFNGLRKSVL